MAVELKSTWRIMTLSASGGSMQDLNIDVLRDIVGWDQITIEKNDTSRR
ncbi:MAG: hypothetical protein H7Z40_20460 [Phycisphaerae bacterium]|nr:hypothetical protein [Gemmatimonadaceae bacterium]